MTAKIFGGVPQGMEPLVLHSLLEQHSIIVNVTATEQAAQIRLQQLTVIAPHIASLYFPAWDCLPYDRASPSLDVMATRMALLEQLVSSRSFCLILSQAALVQYLPPRSSFIGQGVIVKRHANYPREELIAKLGAQGYSRVTSVHEAGEFAVRGSLIDIFPAGMPQPIRLDFFGDELTEIKNFDPFSQRSSSGESSGSSGDSNRPLESFVLQPVKEVRLNAESISCFRNRYRALTHRTSDSLYEAVSAGQHVLGIEHWLPLFFTQLETLLDYLPSQTFVVLDELVEQAVSSYQEQIRDYYLNRLTDYQSKHHFCPLPPEELYWSPEQWQNFLQQQGGRFSPIAVAGEALGRALTALNAHQSFAEKIAILQNYHRQGLSVIIACVSEGSRERIAEMCLQHDVALSLLETWPLPSPQSPQGFWGFIFPLEKGFITKDLVMVSENDLFGDRLHRQLSRTKASAKLLLEVSTLNQSDIVVHRDHGIARFQGLTTINVNSIAHDCLHLVYEGGDKLYLPVENIELITRYGNENAIVTLDRLGNTAWQLRKAKVKKRLHEVAEYLMKIAAERALLQATAFAERPEGYNAFCVGFPYLETDDQLQAIEETLADLSKAQPMDRLVCGDVGFGKTEVALRAAFITVAHRKQVAIIVPTTLLCRQHFATFQERFRKTPYRVAALSRLTSAKDAGCIRQGLADGKIDIVISTHALLAAKINFSDLGLVIIDEEHHFGVKQKEKLKQLKANIHVLSLSATPIPRTLQLALTGIRQLSLIRTPPIDRLAVRTFVGPFDPLTIREAILREQFRGGQVFVVCPRIEEVPKIASQLQKIVPEIRMGIAHGRLSAAQLEDTVSAFYDRQFDLLLSTNIIESGIDIATANTLIVYQANLFGLAQLYQLRGRVGRAKLQGYAYFTVPEEVSAIALKRLELMQTLEHLGAGLELASHDLELRGAGNIVGEEQSGHIKEVGVELYQHLLEEAIALVRAEQSTGPLPDYDWTPQINLSLSVLIPEAYVADLDLRLTLYRRAALLENGEHITAFAAELIDRFGKLPPEVKNLLEVLEIKILCRQAGIEKIDTSPSAIVLTLRHNTFANPQGLLSYLQSLNGAARIRPDQKIVFNWSETNIRLIAVKKICATMSKLARAKVK